jgi:acetyl-CoA C-acetyltransferase
MTELRANDPVLVGIGLVMQREEDPLNASEPMTLMIEAARRAGADTTVCSALEMVQRIYVPRGRWSYTDPGRAIAQAIGASNAHSILSDVGVLQQHLIADACKRIAGGQNSVIMVVGGDAGYRILRGAITSTELHDQQINSEPDELLVPSAALREPAELAAGLHMPVGLYAIIDSALRANLGLSPDQHRDALGSLYERMSQIASTNPHAWDRSIHKAESIRNPSPKNKMQAFPYTKLHCSSWNVDQASALLFMSVGLARELEIPQSQWVFPIVSTESNAMLSVSSRPDLHRSPGARLAGRAALEAADLAVDEIKYLDLYSCFPSALQVCAAELGIPLERDLTVTGSMPFAGGPYNNYVLHSTGQMALLLRGDREAIGLVGCISGVITKTGFGIWSGTPGKEPYRSIDVSDVVREEEHAVPVVADYQGPATIAGYTVLDPSEGMRKAVVVADIRPSGRSVSISEDQNIISRMEAADMVGQPIAVVGRSFVLL